VLVATWRHLQVGLLLDGAGPGYRLPQLAVGAAAGASVALCAYAARLRRGAVLLAGPLLLLALALQLAADAVQPTVVGSGTYAALEGVTMTQAYSSELSIAFDRSPAVDAALLLTSVLAGFGAVVGLARSQV
jgi:hypothetical protein